ncbi:MAG: secretin and TonB N-terminal domain-containing protein [Myxococcales bacterium]|nr:secretin and TonB N-terminal domain-containing protein [Myxococcales bacterium]
MRTLFGALLVVLALGDVAAARLPRGRRISIDVVNADIRNVVRLFSDVAGINFVIADDVRGRVTARLRRVPWRRALRALLASKGLEMHEQGNIVRIARGAVFVAERRAQLSAREHCERHGPLRTWMIKIAYARAADVAKLVRTTLTKRGRVSVDARTNTLIVRDVMCGGGRGGLR